MTKSYSSHVSRIFVSLDHIIFHLAYATSSSSIKPSPKCAADDIRRIQISAAPPIAVSLQAPQALPPPQSESIQRLTHGWYQRQRLPLMKSVVGAELTPQVSYGKSRRKALYCGAMKRHLGQALGLPKCCSLVSR